MGKIVLLDENTSNKIAAGEVVERPASVIKELIENSIDAGADSISIEAKNGGVSLMRVTDNGSGIDDDDVEIAFERHATSKIRSANDLESINSLGFRGEALASIASVSVVELTTRTINKEYGIYARVEGGTVKELKQVGCPVGTSFVVSSLFYNTPARYKFLKKDSTEFGYISEIVNRIALAKPGISFKLTGNSSVALHSPGNNDLLSVIFSIYGKEVSRNLLPIDYEDSILKIKGYAGKPEISRSTREYQSIFINGRYIKSKLISAAIEEAYKTFVMKNKHPFTVLNIEINPLLVDVNVHPTKMEIRFSKEQEVFRSVYHAVNNALLSAPLIRDAHFQEKADNIFKIQDPEIRKADYVQQNIETAKTDIFKNKADVPTQNAGASTDYNKIQNSFEKKVPEKDSMSCDSLKETAENSTVENMPTEDIAIESNTVETNAIENNAIENNTIENRALEYKALENIAAENKGNKVEFTDNICKEIFDTDKYLTGDNINEEVLDKSHDSAKNEIKNKDNASIFENASIIGQVFSTYILLQRENELLLIDQHAAHERIMYEHYRDKFSKKEPFSQMLLTPVVVEIPYNEIKFMEDKKEIFYNLGFIFESFGNNSIIIRSVPFINDINSIKELFLEILDKIKKSNVDDIDIMADEAIYTIACKAAVKANRKLDVKEITSVMEKLGDTVNPYTCPHGRPVIVKLTKYELEKMFKRVL
ncbi:DNA mismatch repair endonuclease MutL [Pseudobacteroides cellulosolvens]|uniref:DNA mismatch repair protein MutL n=1 Tax=Pseudobacteroides cellulosolvens ATCC 35603 = DSM 2933 TaxID=398512 RepID=A0A0L6JJ52_9FIRM|nr:DNA mismatch repair endonuclease MutL [Pseudobacteroides cellulosolvens]KNY25760.1 DNA mismatch repair protein mutL [Pseudobacteroides cellulosolvens ATCC 35603 = DSM 2933]